MSATSNSNENIIYRHFDIQHDFDPLVTLLQRVEQNDHDGEDVSENALRDQLNEFRHDPSLDRWVATTNDINELVGYGAVFTTPNDEHADLYIAVHPAHRWRHVSTLNLFVKKSKTVQAKFISTRFLISTIRN